jgi:hypothetical protein
MSNKTTVKLMPAADVRTGIAKLAKSHKTVQATTVELLNQCLMHGEKYGDFTLLDDLYAALPPSIRRGSVVKWVTDNSPLHFRTETVTKGNTITKTKVFRKDKLEKEPNPWNIERAIAEPFFDMETQANEKDPLTIEETKDALERYLKSLGKRANDDAVDWIKSLNIDAA